MALSVVRWRRGGSLSEWDAIPGSPWHVSVDAGELESAAADYERRVSSAVAGDEEVRRFREFLDRVDPEDFDEG